MMAFCISACGAVLTKETRTGIVGTPLPDLLSCAGKPSSVIAADDTDVDVQYDQSTPTQPNFSLGGVYGISIGLGAMGECHAIFRVHDGYVVGVHYTGPSFTLGGPRSACIPLIKECATRLDRTTLPDNYDQFKVLGVSKP